MRRIFQSFLSILMKHILVVTGIRDSYKDIKINIKV